MLLPESAKNLPGFYGKLARTAPLLITGFLVIKDVVDAFNEKMRKAVESGVKLANSFGTTNEKLTKMGEQLGTVGATDIERYKNDQIVAGISDPKSIAEGQKILDSEIGKQTVDDFRTALASVGRDAAVQSLATQLGMYVAQGIMTPEQAKSFAYAIGQEVGNSTLTADVNMKVNRLIGPNGEDIANEPLKVTLEIQDMNLEAFRSAVQSASDNSVNPYSANTVGRGAFGAAGVATGAVAASQGAKATVPLLEKAGSSILGRELELTKTKLVTGTINKIADTAAKKMAGTIARVTAERAARVAITQAAGVALDATVVGAPVGIALNVLGAIDMALGAAEIAAAVNEYNEALANNAKMGAYATQMGMNMLQQNEQLKDVLETQYDKKLADLETQKAATKDIEEQKRLEQEINDLLIQRESDRKKLQENSAEITKEVLGYIKQDTGKAFGDEGLLKQQTAVTYKDNPIAQDAANVAIKQIEEAGLKDTTFGMTMALQVAYGNIDPMTASAMIQAAKDNKPLQTAVDLLVNTRGLEEGSTVMQLINRAMQGGLNSTMNIPVMVSMMSNSSFSIEALSNLVNLSTSSNGLTLVNEQNLIKTQGLLDQLENANSMLRKSDLVSINEQTGGQFQNILNNWEDLAGSDGVIEKNVLVNYQVAGGDDNAVWQWINANGLQNSQGSSATKEQLIATYRVRYIQSLELDNSNATPDSYSLYTTETKTSSGGSGEDPELKKLQDQQDKKQKALDVIAIREERINKKYDERKKALQDIADAQAEISAQQQNQMDLADALAKGDVAAAARAAQSIQSKNAETAIQQQQDSLENARKSELDKVSFNGMTRDTLEPALDKLKELIAIREYELSGKEKSGGGGGTYQVKVKTEKPAYDASHKQGEGDWVENTKTGKWEWVPKTKTVAPTTSNPYYTPGYNYGGGPVPKKNPLAPIFGNPSSPVRGPLDNPFLPSTPATTPWNFNNMGVAPKTGYVPGSAGKGNVLGPPTPTVSSITDPYKTAYGTGPQSINGIIAQGTPGIQTSMGVLSQAGQKPATDTTTAWGTTISGLPGLVSTQQPAISTSFGGLTTVGKTAASDISSGWNSSLSSLPGAISNQKASVGANFKDLGKTSSSKYKEGWNLFDEIGKVWDSIFGHWATGGLITGPGSGTSDSIPAMLSNGEYVINAAAVEKFGVPFLNSINSMEGFASGGYAAKKPGVKSYATGGVVSGDSAGSSNSVYNYSVVVNAATGASADDIANVAIAKLRAMESRRIGGSR
jgi:hypothetical protein